MGNVPSQTQPAIEHPDAYYGTAKSRTENNQIQYASIMLFRAQPKYRCSGVVLRDNESIRISDIVYRY